LRRLRPGQIRSPRRYELLATLPSSTTLMPTSTTTTGESISPVTSPPCRPRRSGSPRRGCGGEVASLGVQDADRAVLAQEQQRRGLADHVRTTDDDTRLPAISIPNASGSRPRPGPSPAGSRRSEREQAGVAGWMPSMSLAGSIESITVRSGMWAGSGIWTMIRPRPDRRSVARSHCRPRPGDVRADLDQPASTPTLWQVRRICCR